MIKPDIFNHLSLNSKYMSFFSVLGWEMKGINLFILSNRKTKNVSVAILLTFGLNAEEYYLGYYLNIKLDISTHWLNLSRPPNWIILQGTFNWWPTDDHDIFSTTGYLNIHNYIECLKIHGTHLTANNSTNNNVMFFFVLDSEIVYCNSN